MGGASGDPKKAKEDSGCESGGRRKGREFLQRKKNPTKKKKADWVGPFKTTPATLDHP